KNVWAQLGDGTSTERSDPVTAPLAGPIQAIGRSVSSTCAVDPSWLWCWGTRSTGYRDDPEPELHELDLVATSVIASKDQTCVTTADQELLCWGYRLPYPSKGVLGMVEPVLTRDQPLDRGLFDCVVHDGRLDCRDVHGARVRMSRKLAGVQEIHDPRGSLCALDDRGRVHCYVVTWVEDRHELLDLHRLQSPAPMRSIFGAEQDSSL